MMNEEEIVKAFCDIRHVKTATIYGQDRHPEVCYTRYMIWHYLHYCGKIPTSRLAVMFRRNRPSIFRGIRVLKESFQFHRDVRAEYMAIVKKIEGATSAAPSGISG